MEQTSTQTAKRCLSPELPENAECKRFLSPPSSPSIIEEEPASQMLEDRGQIVNPIESRPASVESGYGSENLQVESPEIQESQEIISLENEEAAGNDDVVSVGRPGQEYGQPRNPQAGSPQYRRTPPPFTGLSTAGEVDSMLRRGHMRYGEKEIIEIFGRIM